jgi:hypothetical protein
MKKAEQKKRFYRVFVGLVLGIGLMGLTEPSFSQTDADRNLEPGLLIIVRLHDYAGIRRATLDRAEREMARIFRDIGVDTRWADCPLSSSELKRYPGCFRPAGSAHFDVNIVPRSMARRVSMPENTLAFTSETKEGERVSVVSVFYDRVREQAELSGVPLPRILGNVIAHEVGHVLLCTTGHSSTGIMQARWSPEDLRRVARGQLLFTTKQAELIRSEIRERAQWQPAAKISRLGPPGNMWNRE